MSEANGYYRFRVHIEHPETREVRIHEDDGKDPGPPWNQGGAEGEWYGKDGWYDGPFYMYSEGNNSCSCNRSLFWQRAGGDPDVGAEHCEDGVWRITMVEEIAPDGTVEIIEGDPADFT